MFFFIILHIYFIFMALKYYRNDHMDFYVTFNWPFFLWKKSNLDILQNISFCAAQKKKAHKFWLTRWVHVKRIFLNMNC